VTIWRTIIMNKPFVPPTTPWSAARGGLAQSPIPGFDPRLDLSDQALVVASQNAYPVIAKHKARSDRFGLLAGAAVALVLGGITFTSMNSGRAGKASSATALVPAQVTQTPSSRRVALPPGVATQPLSSMSPPQPETTSGLMPASGPMPSAGMANMTHISSPVVVFDTSIGSTADTGGRPSPISDAGTPALLAGASGVQVADGGQASSVRSSAMADPANTIVQGTLIPAVLETAIHSELPGYARAVVSQDVRSFDGSKILVPRSSRLIGEYKGGTSAGQTRVYLMWTRLVRPDGVSIALASPAADAVGQAGVGGKVNDHFLQRFGSAILLSLVGSASAIGGGGATVVMSGGGQSAASVAAERDSQRLPTIHVMQGEPIRVFTARDLIFAPAEASRG
jgi:type IV secretion system protein VirB10